MLNAANHSGRGNLASRRPRVGIVLDLVDGKGPGKTCRARLEAVRSGYRKAAKLKPIAELLVCLLELLLDVRKLLFGRGIGLCKRAFELGRGSFKANY
ncbi:hypothetical protein [Mesorhizobium neociceri]|uniref:Uncharacterized protein n=1 Tax=Mesorhizobium neociceri TaxID=1307853 RepID=A0A838B5V7_9HYPH|nr:hypothetical protein [Mesorhizobium neociceri]MBA1141775.1 hypothetical protein [Mesorhizobium neociceri]